MSGLKQFEKVTKTAVEGLMSKKVTNNSLCSRQIPKSLPSLRDPDRSHSNRKVVGHFRKVQLFDLEHPTGFAMSYPVSDHAAASDASLIRAGQYI